MACPRVAILKGLASIGPGHFVFDCGSFLTDMRSRFGFGVVCLFVAAVMVWPAVVVAVRASHASLWCDGAQPNG